MKSLNKPKNKDNMCFKPFKQNNIEVAQDDIHVAKVFERITDNSGNFIYMAPYQPLYCYGPMNNGDEFRAKYFGQYENLHYADYQGFGNYYGFHSFVNQEDALSLRWFLVGNEFSVQNKTFVVFICVIPKGTMFMRGVDGNGKLNYVSEYIRPLYEIGNLDLKKKTDSL